MVKAVIIVVTLQPHRVKSWFVRKYRDHMSKSFSGPSLNKDRYNNTHTGFIVLECNE